MKYLQETKQNQVNSHFFKLIFARMQFNIKPLLNCNVSVFLLLIFFFFKLTSMWVWFELKNHFSSANVNDFYIAKCISWYIVFQHQTQKRISRCSAHWVILASHIHSLSHECSTAAFCYSSRWPLMLNLLATHINYINCQTISIQLS